MNPTTAAQLLQLSVEATPAEIEAAYRRLSRASHPDRFVGEGTSVTTAATAQFVRMTEARETLLRLAAARSGEQGGQIPLPYDGYEVTTRRTRSWIAFAAWSGLLLIALVLSVIDDSAELKVADILLRLIPLAVASIAFALTGRREWLVVTVLFVAVSVVVTIAIASFGPLLSLEILLVPVLGLGAIGVAQMRQRYPGRRRG